MARNKTGILGTFSGKVGTVVGCNIGDTFYVRSLPVRRAMPTENELVNRAKFKVVQDCLHPIKNFLKTGFKDYGTKTGGYRSAVSYTRKNAVAGDDAGFYIDPALLKVSGGDLTGAVNPTAVYEQPSQMKFSWEVSDLHHREVSDQVMLLVYDLTAKKAVYIINGAFRKTGTQVIGLPDEFAGKEVDIYIGFVAADRSRQSDSQYLGRVLLK